MGTQYIDTDTSKRDQFWWIDPEELVIARNEGDLLYDERIHAPLTEEFVANIMALGVKQPITVRKNGDTLEVIDGRRRTRGAIEANKRLRKMGEKPLLVPIMPQRGLDERTAVGLMISLNDQRENDDLLTEITKTARLVNAGRMTVEEAALYRGKDKKTIERYLDIAEMPGKVHTAIRAGKLSVSAAWKLRALRGEQLDEALSTLTAHRTTVQDAHRVASGDPAAAKTATRPRKVAEIRERLERLDPSSPEARAIRWVLREEEWT